MAQFHQGLPEQKAETQQLSVCRSSEGLCSLCVHVLVRPCGSRDSCHPPWHLLFPEEVKRSYGLTWI